LVQDKGAVSLTFVFNKAGAAAPLMVPCDTMIRLTQAGNLWETKFDCSGTFAATTDLQKKALLGELSAGNLDAKLVLQVDVGEWKGFQVNLSAPIPPQVSEVTIADCSAPRPPAQKCIVVAVTNAILPELAGQVAKKLEQSELSAIPASLRNKLKNPVELTSLTTSLAKYIYFYTRDIYCAGNARDVPNVTRVEFAIPLNDGLPDPLVNRPGEPARWAAWFGATDKSIKIRPVTAGFCPA
jgi:hypothetical protein